MQAASGRAAQAQRLCPDVRVVVLSMYDTEEYVLRALRCGAKGYLLKNIDLAELETAVKSVAAGQTFLTPAIQGHVIEGYLSEAGDAVSDLDRLTPRQREVLQLVTEGQTTNEIADKLHLSAKTIDTHRTKLMEQLNIHDLAGLVRYAIRVGLVDPGA